MPSGISVVLNVGIAMALAMPLLWSVAARPSDARNFWKQGQFWWAVGCLVLPGGLYVWSGIRLSPLTTWILFLLAISAMTLCWGGALYLTVRRNPARTDVFDYALVTLYIGGLLMSARLSQSPLRLQAVALIGGVFLTQYFQCSGRFTAGSSVGVTRKRDVVTDCWDRATIDLILNKEFDRATSSRSDLSVVMIDFDRLKQINDSHGHLAGDRALRALADALQSNIRRGDALGRFGGDEFLAVLPGASAEVARNVANRIRDSLAEIASPQISASLGTASRTKGDTLADLIQRADGDMYQRKVRGR